MNLRSQTPNIHIILNSIFLTCFPATNVPSIPGHSVLEYIIIYPFNIYCTFIRRIICTYRMKVKFVQTTIIVEPSYRIRLEDYLIT